MRKKKVIKPRILKTRTPKRSKLSKTSRYSFYASVIYIDKNKGIL